jgi:metallo-beta-lactamase class B
MKTARLSSTARGVVVCSALALAAAAQAPPQAPAKPDTPEIKALIEQTRNAAGPRWAYAVHFWCEEPRANRADDPVIPPTKIFDNVYAIGNSGTTVYVLQTSAGLLMIDALGSNQVDSQLLPGFQKLGLAPAQVKSILVAHGHADHFGGAAYFQEHFGSKVYVSAADWHLMENPPAQRGRGPTAPVAPLPKHDGDIKDGDAIVLGDLKVMPVAVPGHTPGAMGFIFPVRDNGATHMAAMFGGVWLTPGLLSDDGLQTYLKSIARFRDESRKAKVDVLLQNHTLMDPIQERLDRLAARKKGEPHPFVVGTNEYQKFLDVMEGCTQVNIARRRL